MSGECLTQQFADLVLMKGMPSLVLVDTKTPSSVPDTHGSYNALKRQIMERCLFARLPCAVLDFKKRDVCNLARLCPDWDSPERAGSLTPAFLALPCALFRLKTWQASQPNPGMWKPSARISIGVHQASWAF